MQPLGVFAGLARAAATPPDTFPRASRPASSAICKSVSPFRASTGRIVSTSAPVRSELSISWRAVPFACSISPIETGAAHRSARVPATGRPPPRARLLVLERSLRRAAHQEEKRQLVVRLRVRRLEAQQLLVRPHCFLTGLGIPCDVLLIQSPQVQVRAREPRSQIDGAAEAVSAASVLSLAAPPRRREKLLECWLLGVYF